MPSFFLTIDEVHAIMGPHTVTRAAIYLATQRGEFDCRRLGKRVLIVRSSFLRWLNGPDNTQPPKPATDPEPATAAA